MFDPLTEDEYKARVLSDVGMKSNQTLIDDMDTLWRMDSAYSYDVELHYLATRLRVTRWLLGQNWELFDWVEYDVQKKESQRVRNLIMLRDSTKEEISELLVQSQSFFLVSQILAGGPGDAKLPASFPYISDYDQDAVVGTKVFHR